jgi:hypothetical protein
MSDYTNHSTTRSDGISVKGLLITVFVLVGLLAVMSLFGGNAGTEAETEGTPVQIETAPAGPAVIE